jgi:hypothetical protein
MGNERDDALRFCSEQRSEMERNWAKNGQFIYQGQSFCAWVFATHEPGGPETWTPEEWGVGPKMERPRTILVTLPKFAMRPDLRNTDIFGYMLRKFAKATVASGVLVCAESWIKEYRGEGMSEVDVRRLRAEDPASLEHAPGRQEALFMSLEHRAVGRRAWRSIIQRNPSRLLPWEQADMTTSPLTCNLTGIVDTSS